MPNPADRFAKLQRAQMVGSTPAEAGIAKAFQDPGDASQGTPMLQQMQGGTQFSQQPYVPGNSTGMDQAQGQKFDQARANLTAKYGNTGAVPENYEQKAAALQNIIDNAGSQQAIQNAQQQLQQLKANQPQKLNVDDLENI